MSLYGATYKNKMELSSITNVHEIYFLFYETFVALKIKLFKNYIKSGILFKNFENGCNLFI